MNLIYATLAMGMLLLQPFFLSFNDPEGWTVLKEAIEKTRFSDIDKLRDRTFELVVPGGTTDYKLAVEPEAAFKVTRLGPDTFRVTIVNPEALVKRDLIVEYYPIGWHLQKEDPFKPAIEGETSCHYNIKFSQTGVGELNLADFSPAVYEVTYELSDEAAILSVQREPNGPGYSIERVANSVAEVKMRLRIKKKAGGLDLYTGWVKIPACKTGETTQVPAPVTQISTPPPAPPTPVVSAASAIDIRITHVSFCNNANGEFCTTLEVKATNNGTDIVRCNSVFFYLKYGGTVVDSNKQWVQVAPGSSHTFQVGLKAPSKPIGGWTYTIEKLDCFYK